MNKMWQFLNDNPEHMLLLILMVALVIIVLVVGFDSMVDKIWYMWRQGCECPCW
jgi:hypothetical protein